MAIPFKPKKVKLFCGFIYSEEAILEKCLQKLKKKYGLLDNAEIFTVPFLHTQYYNETGNSLKKSIVSFQNLIKRENMPRIKLFTNKIERIFVNENSRKINIDPGYITLSNVFLASCKDYYHRIYVGKGVYIENELRFTEKRYIPFEWTYPDYKSKEYIEYFDILRKVYHNQIKKG